jgi:MoxR-like ATPase
MKAKVLKDTLKELIKAKLPVFVWGSPGIGKSSIVKQIAKEENLEFIDLRLSLLDPTDLKGIPFFDSSSKEAIWAEPEFLPKDKNSSGILFLDEINTAPPSVQAAAYQLILDRKIGSYELPSNWAIIAAGNRASDRGVVYKMPSPLLNRFVHLELDVDFKNWKNWAYENSINPLIIAFLEQDNSKLFTFEPEEMQNAFATPRSWEYVDKILKSKIDKKSLLELLKGTIGDVAINFVNFIKITNELPKIKDILNGTNVDLPSSSQALFALNSFIVSHAKSATKEQLENIIDFSFKLPKEFAIALIRDMQQNKIEIEDLEKFEEWVEEFSYLLE